MCHMCEERRYDDPPPPRPVDKAPDRKADESKKNEQRS
jgi:hypothetical protein